MRLNSEELLAELSWLRRLARSLVGPVGSEDDLVQEAWLAASRVQGGVSRAWLVGTLRRLAARWHRGESRLRRRESASAKPEAVDTQPLLERSELLGVVLQELRSLDEPFRTILLLIYQEGLSVQECAARLGLPQDTVRWRRRAGLDRLRGRLDSNVDPATDWRGAFLPLLVHPSMKPILVAAPSGAAMGSWTYVVGSVMTWKVISAVVLVGAAMWLAVFGLGGQAGQRPEREAALPAELETESAAVFESPAEQTAVVENRRAVIPVPSPEGAPASSLDGPVLTVTVLDQRQHPISGARVWTGAAPDSGVDFWVSDEDGLARIPLASLVNAHTLSGNTDELYGRDHYLPSLYGDAQTLVLAPDADVPVLVVNAAGEPLEGVPVGLARRTHLRGQAGTMSLNFLGVVTTDVQGACLLRHVRWLAALSGQQGEILVGPAVLLRSRSDRNVDLQDLPSEPVRLVLPPTGSLDLRVLDADGGQNRAPTDVRLVIDPSPGRERTPEELHEQLRFSESGVVHVNLTDGVARLPFVGLDLPLIAEAREAEPTQSTFGHGRSPRSSSGDEELILEPMITATEIVGVLHTNEGLPIAKRSIHVSISFRGQLERNGVELETTTAANGRFRVNIDDEHFRIWNRTQTHHLRVSVSGANPLERLVAEAELPGSPSRGRNDLGVLLCAIDSPLFRGHAEDESGAPVQLSAKSLEVLIGAQSGPRTYRLVNQGQVFVAGNEFAFFAPDQGLSAEFGETFLLSGTVDGRPWVRREVLPGPSDVVLVFERGAQLTGSVVMAGDDKPIWHSVDFYCLDAAGIERRYGRATFLLDGSFVVKGLPAKPGRFEIRGPNSREPVVTIEHVLPVFDGETGDSRLAGIDLRVAQYDYKLEIVDQEGRPVEGVSLEAEGYSEPQVPYEAGRLVLRTKQSLLVAVLRAPGMLTQHLSLPPGEHQLVMELEP